MSWVESPISDEAAEAMHRATVQAVHRSTERAWSPTDLKWQELRPESLTDDDRLIVRFLTFVEDHIPAYLNYALSGFPTTGDLDVPTYLRNRDYFRFLVAWANDEEKHASVLTRYQIEAEMSDEESLALELAEIGKKPWSLPYQDPLELYVYTFLQEKATQLFYQRYQSVVSEPVLKDLLQRLARDETRHFAFYSRLVEDSLQRMGPKACDGVKNVLSTFRMPLDGVLDGYWRMGLAAVDAVGHDHTEAYEALGKLIRRFANTLGTPSMDDLSRLIRTSQRMP
jgi:hypothetical protein